jgi:hypothetical protein
LRFEIFLQAKLSIDLLPWHQDLGIKTHNALDNLGSLVVPILAFALLIVILLLSIITKYSCPRRISKLISTKKVESCTWNPLLWFVISCSVPLSIACYLEIQKPVEGENLAWAVGNIALLMVCVVLPVALFLSWVTPKDKFGEHAYFLRYGFMVKKLRMNSWPARLYRTIFILRRLVLLLIGFLMIDYPQFQMFIICATNLASLIYVG